MDSDAALLLQQVIGQQAQIAGDVSAVRTDIAKTLTRLEVLDARVRDTSKTIGDHEARIRMLERFRYTIGGIALLGGIAAGYIGELIGTHVH